MSATVNHFNRLWDARYEMLHGTQDTDLQLIRSAELAEIKYYHSRPHLLKFEDRHYSSSERSLEELLQGPPSIRRRWLRRVKKSAKETKTKGPQQAHITKYFEQTKQRDDKEN